MMSISRLIKRFRKWLGIERFGRCVYCNRPIYGESARLGYGPACIKKRLANVATTKTALGAGEIVAALKDSSAAPLPINNRTGFWDGFK